MIVLGLGSNLGDKQQNLQTAIANLSAILLNDIKTSRVYETTPLLPPSPEPDWHEQKYLNMAVAGELKTSLSPQDILTIIKDIESKSGRKPAARWAPRIIDIDILAIDDLVYSTENLTIPHIGLLERDFAILPFSDVAPEWIHPITKIAAKEYARQHNLSPICS